MKIMLCLLLLSIVGAKASGNNTYGIPTYLDQNTNTIETYNPVLTNPIRSHAHGDAFANYLKSNLNANFPNIAISRTDRRDASVTYTAIINDASINNYEMVFFGGHGFSDKKSTTGNVAGFVTYEHGSISPIDRTYGGWTRWVFMDFCQFMRNHNASFYSHMFAGLHAVFGYESDMWYYIISYNCYCFGGCCSHHRSESKYENFAAKWAKVNGIGLWDAWSQANQEIQYNQGGVGNAPAVVYNYYAGWQGLYFDGSQERINTIFNGDVPVSSLRHKFVSYGTPTYN